MADDWSRDEVKAIIADYFAMLSKEIRGEPCSKTAHRKALSVLLNGRSDGSIERKHQNISAVLISLGYPYISGYKPLANFQQLLLGTVGELLAANRALEGVVREAVDAPVVPISRADDILGRLVAPPKRQDRPRLASESGTAQRTLVPPTVNYLEREARNASLGRAGENFLRAFFALVCFSDQNDSFK